LIATNNAEQLVNITFVVMLIAIII